MAKDIELKVKIDTESASKALAQLRAESNKFSAQSVAPKVDTTKATADVQKFVKEAKTGLESISGVAAKAFEFNQIQQGVEGISSTIQSFGGGFVQLDTAVAKFKTLGAENAKMGDELQKQALEMASTIPFQAAQIADAMTNAAASGVQGGVKELAGFTEVAGKLAVGGGASIDAVVAGLGATLNAFGATAADAGKYADSMFNIVNAGVTTIDELNQYLSQVTPTAAAAGVSFDNVGGALALMTQKGVPTAQATTKLNALMLELVKPGKQLSDTLLQAGLSAEQVAKSMKEKGLPATLDLVGNAFQKVGKTATQAFSSSEAGAAFNILQGQKGQFQDFVNTVTNTSGSAEFAYQQMADTVEVRSKQFAVNVETMKTKLLAINPAIGASVTYAANAFGSVAPSLTPLILAGGQIKSVFSGSFEFISTNLKNLPNMASSASKAVGGAFSSGATFFKNAFSALPGIASSVAGQIGGLFTAPAATISGAFNGIKVAAASAWASISAPVVLVVAGIALVSAALYGFFTQTKEGAEVFANIKQYFLDLWQSIKDFANNAIESIRAFYADNKEVFAQIGGILIELGRFVFEWMITPFQLAWQAVKLFGTGVSLVASAVANFIAKLFPAKQEVAATATATQGAQQKMSGLAQVLLYIRGVIGGVTGAFVAIKSVITEFVSSLADLNINKIKDILTGAGDNISKGFTDGWNKATQAAKDSNTAQVESTKEAAKQTTEEAKAAADKKAENDKKAASDKAKLDAEALKQYLEDQNKRIAKAAEAAKIEQDALAISREAATTTAEQLALDKERLASNKKLLADLEAQLKKGVVGGITITKDNRSAVTEAITKLQEDIAKTELEFKPRIAKINVEGLAEARRKIQEQVSNLQADITARVVPVVPAKKQLIDLLSSQVSDLEAQIKAIVDVDPAKAAELRLKVKELTDKISEETKILIKEEFVGASSTAVEAEYRKSTIIAQQAYQDRTALLGRSLDEEQKDFADYLKARMDAEQAYIQNSISEQTKAASFFGDSLQKSLQEAFATATAQSEEEQNAVKERQASYADETAEIEKQYARRLFNQQTYYDKLRELEERRAKEGAEASKNEQTLWQRTASAVGEAFKALGANQLTAIQTAVQGYQSLLSAQRIFVADRDRANAQLISIEDTTSESYKQALKDRQTADSSILQSQLKSQEALQTAYSNSVTALAAAGGQAIATGKSVLKAMITTALDALQAMVPIWSAQIIAGSLATPTSIATFGVSAVLQYSALIALMTAAVQGAKAAVAGLGFRKGGHTGNMGVNEVAGVVHGQEYVMTAENTAKNRRHFDIIHKNNLSIEEYAKKYLSRQLIEGNAVNLSREYVSTINTAALERRMDVLTEETRITRQEVVRELKASAKQYQKHTTTEVKVHVAQKEYNAY